jgi:hypothetical protein
MPPPPPPHIRRSWLFYRTPPPTPPLPGSPTFTSPLFHTLHAVHTSHTPQPRHVPKPLAPNRRPPTADRPHTPPPYCHRPNTPHPPTCPPPPTLFLPCPSTHSGLVFEDPTGELFPWRMAEQVAEVRAAMDGAGWPAGHLLIHSHHAYAVSEASVLEALASGATGLWCGVSREGASVGHCSSAVTLVNLARLGNAKVSARYNLMALRNAAVEVRPCVCVRVDRAPGKLCSDARACADESERPCT